MATYGEEPADSYFYSYNPYRHVRPREPGWKYKTYLSHCGDAADAFSNQQRAQLKSILSQINPKLTPRLRKANTKDVAVQVNPKKDSSVQCSIGPRTLQAMKRDFQRKRTPEPDTPGSPKAAGGVRYPRTLAVYSPIAYRSVTSFLVEDGDGKEETSDPVRSAAEPAGEQPEPALTEEEEEDEDTETETKKLQHNKKSKPQLKSEDAPTENIKGKARVRFQVSSRAHRS